MTELIIAIGGLIAGISALIATTIKAAKEKDQSRDSQYSHEEKLLELSSSSNQSSKRIEERLEKIDDTVVSLSQEQKQFSLMVLRGSILSIYYTYESQKRIPEGQYATMLGYYDVYKMLGGNGFTEEHVEKMKQWVRF